MNILLTGAFGNVGRSTLTALLERGDRVRTFDLPTPANRKAARALDGRIDPTWGDLRRPDDLAAAVNMPGGLDAVIHLAFVIPTLSATGVRCEERPDFARTVNVGGTRNLIDALNNLEKRPRLVFASSLHVYGPTQHLAPPRTTDETPAPIEHYARHKVEAEGMVRQSGLEWCIMRLAAALPVRLILDRAMFDVPLDNRIEFIHTRDAGQGFAAAAGCPATAYKTLLLGGGPRCQLIYRQIMTEILETVGVGALPECCFTTTPFSVDWLDTRESQALLGYQQRTFDDYTADLRCLLGPLRHAARAFRPLVRRWLISRSPYIKAGKAAVRSSRRLGYTTVRKD